MNRIINTKIKMKKESPKRGYPLRGNPSRVKYLIYLIDAIIILASIGFLSTVFPIITNEISYRLKSKKEMVYIPQKVQVKNGEVKLTDYETKKIISQKKIRIIYPVSSDFGIIIPKINVNYKIIPNVNPYDEKEYTEALKRGVVHAKGTDFPGTGRKIYLFSHSSSSIWQGTINIAFYLLKELEKEDKIYLFYRNLRYDYEVTEKIITGPDLKKYLSEDLDKDILILQTCWPAGTNLKRLIILAKSI